MSSCNLKALPVGLGYFGNNLLELRLANNSLTSGAFMRGVGYFKRLPKLRVLSLAFNEMTTFKGQGVVQ